MKKLCVVFAVLCCLFLTGCGDSIDTITVYNKSSYNIDVTYIVDRTTVYNIPANTNRDFIVSNIGRIEAVKLPDEVYCEYIDRDTYFYNKPIYNITVYNTFSYPILFIYNNNEETILLPTENFNYSSINKSYSFKYIVEDSDKDYSTKKDQKYIDGDNASLLVKIN